MKIWSNLKFDPVFIYFNSSILPEPQHRFLKLVFNFSINNCVTEAVTTPSSIDFSIVICLETLHRIITRHHVLDTWYIPLYTFLFRH
jgi:hypothetical protein